MSDLSSASRSDRLDRALFALLSQTREIEAAAVVSFDGLPMASSLPPGMDEDRVAAMSAALLSLGERAAQGLGRGELSQVYIEGETGTVFLVSADNEAVLVAVASQGAKVGLLLYEVRRAAAAVAKVLREDEPVPVPAVPAQPAPEPVLSAAPAPVSVLTAVPSSPAHALPTPPAQQEPAAAAFYVSPLDSGFASSSYDRSGTPSGGPGSGSPTWS